MTHPMRHTKIHTFERIRDICEHDETGAEWIAMFHPYRTYPVHFTGATRAAVIEAAEAMRAEAIEKHEAACIAREEGRRKAAETRARKVKA